MKKIAGLLLTLSLLAGSVLAQGPPQGPPGPPGVLQSVPQGGAVPEVDPSFLAASVALLIGGALLFGHRKK